MTLTAIQPNSSHTLKPIGVIDSGVGGLTVLKHIHALLPNELIRYYADSAYAPYGPQTEAQIKQRCFAITDHLLTPSATHQPIKALVVACNTATAAAIRALRAHYHHLPIVGMEPAVKPAVQATQNGIIGVLATAGTLRSAQFAALLESHGTQVNIITQACIGLVECIEQGELNTTHTQQLIQSYCQPLVAAGADTIVLGCTHYPFVRHWIEAAVNTGQNTVSMIETGPAVARRLQTLLKELGLCSPRQQTAHIYFESSSQTASTMQIMQQLWQSLQINQAA